MKAGIVVNKTFFDSLTLLETYNERKVETLIVGITNRLNSVSNMWVEANDKEISVIKGSLDKKINRVFDLNPEAMLFFTDDIKQVSENMCIKRAKEEDIPYFLIRSKSRSVNDAIEYLNVRIASGMKYMKPKELALGLDISAILAKKIIDGGVNGEMDGLEITMWNKKNKVYRIKGV